MKAQQVNKTEQSILADLGNIRTRIDTYKKLAKSADLVIITLVCSDSRVVLPEFILDLPVSKNKTKKALLITIPTIGGGQPSRSRVRGVIKQVLSWGVQPEKLRILVTQHGDTQEINEIINTGIGNHHISCGLRSFFDKHRVELQEIRSYLLPWSDNFKRLTGNVRNAPDRLPLTLLQAQCPEAMEIIKNISDRTATKEGYRIPQRLILRAAYRNGSEGIEINGENVRSRMSEYLREQEFKKVYKTCEIGLADYNHQEKSLSFLRPYANLGVTQKKFQIPGLKPRTNLFQDPSVVIVSFGESVISLNNGILFPHFAGSGEMQNLHPIDNVFRACASIPTPQTLLCGLAEASYAVFHHLNPHPGDKNFNNLKDMIIVCESEKYVKTIKATIKNDEFQSEYLPMFKQMNDGKLFVVNLHLDSKAEPEMITIIL